MTRRSSLPAAAELFGADAAGSAPDSGARRGHSRDLRVAERRPSGRERHDEKITVYVSAAELVDLEQARLTLRAEHGTGVDRGRIVREALAMALEDLDDQGEASALVRRLRGT
ncbi:MAG TPA: cobyrinic acid a,c-diamide synthase [Mycobacteriales bacterium]|nr:cobyrinic acid a,c-diamide synthase [Mycobacteriales bacterium]